MLDLLIAVIGIVITIFLVVGVHELGHFLAARACGIKVLRFSIGFGKAFYSWHDKKGTEYVLAPIPLGGYVKMLDEGEEKVAEKDLPFAYNRQPIYKKIIVVAFGPLANLIFAFFIYWLLFLIGFITPVPIIGKITPQSIADQAGLKPQQEIISINQQKTPTWLPVLIQILSHTGDKDHLSIEVKNVSNKKIETRTLDLKNWVMNDLKPDPLDSLGIIPFEPEVTTVIGNIATPQSALKVGDKILSINNQSIEKWGEIQEIILAHPEEKLRFVIERNRKNISLEITPSIKRDIFFTKYGYLGIAPQVNWPKDFLRTNQYGPIVSLRHAWDHLKDFTYINFIVLGKIFTGKISLQSLGGPITIFESAGTALNQGLIAFLNFLAFLSISIGIINILPIPGLDGGHVFLQVIELIIRRPIPLRVQLLLYRLGLIALFLLITQALINDVMRLL